MKKALLFLLLIAFAGCARMGQPDGGWYDDMPPRILSSTPADRSVGVDSKRIIINFDEYIKLENPTEKVVVSPPQKEPAEIKVQGRRIVVDLKDSLKPNTTYTIDFSDAITDNNEGNPMGNYTYSFSTGSAIDTMEVGGYVMEASNLEPVKGMLVGLYAVDETAGETAADPFRTMALQRISRTDGNGHFVIKGVANGTYKVYALQDTDGDYMLTQRGEKLAFMDETIATSSKPDIRQDTVWVDSLHIEAINRVGYTHFYPDDIVLRAFTEISDELYLMKSERRDADRLTFAFSRGYDRLPQLRPLNAAWGSGDLLAETSLKNDTIVYWLRDTALVNTDTLTVEAKYFATDTLGNIEQLTDTIEFISKIPYSRRMKDHQKMLEQWLKQQERAAKQGKEVKYVPPGEALEPRYRLTSEIDPNTLIEIDFPVPLQQVDTTRLHIYAKKDSLWYNVGFKIAGYGSDNAGNAKLPKPASIADKRRLFVQAAWTPGTEYSFEVDSAAFTDIYKHVSQKFKKGFRVRGKEEYATLFVNVSGAGEGDVIVQLLSASDKVLKEEKAIGGTAEFYYLRPGTYNMRAFVDSNGNGEWDNGCYDEQRQPEMVYYYPRELEVRERWDMTENWNLTATPAYRQKPTGLMKEKNDSLRRARNQNAERARKLGKTYVPQQR